MRFHSVFILACMLIVTACGQTGGESNTKRTTRITEEQIQAVMENQNIECDAIKGGSCPEGVTRLLIIDKNNADNSGVCSGFMVNENTMITNQHCIKDQFTCNNTYVAIYNGYGYQKTKCDKVVKIISDYADPNDPRKALDVAVVKLKDRFFGETFKIAQTRPEPLDTVTAWVVDHTGLDRETPNLVESRITEFNCYIGREPGRSSMILKNCPVIAGNSGSPVVNSVGEIIGVIWGGTSKHLNSKETLNTRRVMIFSAAVTEAIYFKDYVTAD